MDTPNKDLSVAGIVSKTNVRQSKNGKPFVLFTIEDYSGSLDLALFGEDYLKRVDFLNTLRGILADRLKRAISDFDLLQATVEENIIALAKVKGIKL